MLPHSRMIHARHAVREGNWPGLFAWAFRAGAPTALRELAEWAGSDVADRGGVIHLWGHSWELENEGLWDLLDETLSIIAGVGGRAVTNAELGEALFAGSD